MLANLRSEPRIAAETVIGKLCPGDGLYYVNLQKVGSEMWYRVQVVETAGDCDPLRAPVGAEGWAAASVVADPSFSVSQFAWNNGIDIPTAIPPTAAPRPTIPPRPAIRPQAPAASCDPSYPDICIPANSPDLDCGEIGYRRFRVVGSDPHGFDRDNDGIGCEN